MKSRTDRLVERYAAHCSLPWEPHLAGPQKVWFAIYDKGDELKVRHRLTAFDLATREAGHGFHLVDLTNTFGDWLSSLDYLEALFAEPELLAPAYPQYLSHVADLIRATLERASSDDVVALVGVGTLFPMIRVGDLVHEIAPAVRGRLLVLFPGEHQDNHYRLLDARDGWNYLAVPLTATSGADA